MTDSSAGQTGGKRQTGSEKLATLVAVPGEASESVRRKGTRGVEGTSRQRGIDQAARRRGGKASRR